MDVSYGFCDMASWSQLYPYAAGFQDLQALLQSTGGVDKQMCFVVLKHMIYSQKIEIY